MATYAPPPSSRKRKNVNSKLSVRTTSLESFSQSASAISVPSSSILASPLRVNTLVPQATSVIATTPPAIATPTVISSVPIGSASCHTLQVPSSPANRMLPGTPVRVASVPILVPMTSGSQMPTVLPALPSTPFRTTTLSSTISLPSAQIPDPASASIGMTTTSMISLDPPTPPSSVPPPVATSLFLPTSMPTSISSTNATNDAMMVPSPKRTPRPDTPIPTALPSPFRVIAMASNYADAISSNASSILKTRDYRLSGIVHEMNRGVPKTLMVQAYTPLGDVVYIMIDTPGSIAVVEGISVTLVAPTTVPLTLDEKHLDYVQFGREKGCGILFSAGGFIHVYPYSSDAKFYQIENAGGMSQDTFFYPVVSMSDLIDDPAMTSSRIHDATVAIDHLAMSEEQSRFGDAIEGIRDMITTTKVLYVNLSHMYNARVAESNDGYARFRELSQRKQTYGLSSQEEAEMKAVTERLSHLTDVKVRLIRASRFIGETISSHRDNLVREGDDSKAQLFVSSHRHFMRGYNFQEPQEWDLPSSLGSIDYLSSSPQKIVTLTGDVYNEDLPTSIVSAL